MARNFKVAELLSPDDFAGLQAFVREKNLARSADDCHEWCLAKGYTLSRTAVWNWLDAFRMEEKTRRAAEISTAYLESAAGTDPTAVASATLKKFQELVFDYVVRADEADAGELMKLSIAMKTGLNAQQVIGNLRQTFDAATRKLVDRKQVITDADIADVRKAMFGG